MTVSAARGRRRRRGVRAEIQVPTRRRISDDIRPIAPAGLCLCGGLILKMWDGEGGGQIGRRRWVVVHYPWRRHIH